MHPQDCQESAEARRVKRRPLGPTSVANVSGASAAGALAELLFRLVLSALLYCVETWSYVCLEYCAHLLRLH